MKIIRNSDINNLVYLQIKISDVDQFGSNGRVFILCQRIKPYSIKFYF